MKVIKGFKKKAISIESINQNKRYKSQNMFNNKYKNIINNNKDIIARDDMATCVCTSS